MARLLRHAMNIHALKYSVFAKHFCGYLLKVDFFDIWLEFD